ncbi:hypothetical protein CYLTODRAFT_417875 [Cylindrobasidium torrendii FP15055 ss-10]|uniref:ferric-chelate reductase (NADPH) n=1 Tax=Cylindrobasidium torrendii FP15055 ss-10 TaxID=1314674 RepID=A0A0D7BQN5_9AGAR|nr:hypothetical protein CYLTODRAFT_417875 [Cylindrobasidium torrendii FP15055 ss-10]
MMDHDASGTYYNGHYVPTQAERTAYQAAHSDAWAKTVCYGYYGIYFFAAGIGFAAIYNVYWTHLQKRAIRNIGRRTYSSPSMSLAFARAVGYRRLPTFIGRFVAPWVTVGNRATTLLLLLGTLFTTLYMFALTYYYRPPFYGSAPLGLRSEWLAMATLPFLVAFAQKINIVSVLTGASHQKLQVLHQGVAGLHFYTSLVHTIAMSIRSARERGLGYDWKMNEVYWTGFAALVPLVWLCFASLPVFRNAGYEFFWIFHLAAVGAYFGFLYIHVAGHLDGSAYMYATFAVFAFGSLLRLGNMLHVNLGHGLHTAHVTLRGPSLIAISIPTNLTWMPGQHVFLRFPGVRPLESHPFSICSIPSTSTTCPSQMGFLLAPNAGFTLSLKKKLQKAPRQQLKLTVLLDGPFGCSSPEMRAFDGVMLIAGGSGIAAVLPVFLDLAQCLQAESANKTRCQWVHLIWVVRRDRRDREVESTLHEAVSQNAIVTIFETEGTAHEGHELAHSKASSEAKIPPKQLLYTKVVLTCGQPSKYSPGRMMAGLQSLYADHFP